VGPELKLNNVSFKYGQDWCIQDLGFELRKGEIIGVIGPNGSGKSTLLKIIDGVLRAQKGDVLLGGKSLYGFKRSEIARHIAMVPQESVFSFPFSAFDVVLMGRFPYSGHFPFEKTEDIRIAQESMELTSTIDLAMRSIHELSGGEKQRVLIARALTQRAKIILLDEPTSFLDIRHKLEIFEIISSLTHSMGLIIVSHDISLAAQFCHRVILLNKGKIYKTGTPSEVVTAENIGEVYQCPVLVDENPVSNTPRITILSRKSNGKKESL